MEQRDWIKTADGLAIRDLETKVRDLITHPRRQDPLLKDRARWNILTSALDVIGDTELAIEAYVSGTTPQDPGECYLLIYGILQVLFVQQDAARNIVRAFTLPFTAQPRLQDIRDIRNQTIGHPANTGKASHFLSRFSMSKAGYQLMTTHHDGSYDIRRIDVFDLISKQRSVIKEVLQETMDALEKEDMEHREKFKDEKLIDYFPSTNSYLMSKIAEACYSESPSARPIGQAAVNTIRQHLAGFKAALEVRGVLNSSSHLIHYFDELWYPLEQLDHFLHYRESDLNERSGYIFAFFVRHKLEDMRQIAKEIDEEYAAETFRKAGIRRKRPSKRP